MRKERQARSGRGAWIGPITCTCCYSAIVPYADERASLLPRLRKHAAGRVLQDALRLDGQSLRFHLGTSLADLRVPVSIAPSLQQAFETAVRDLFFLLALRHRS